MTENNDATKARAVPGWDWLRQRTSRSDRVVYAIVLLLVLASVVVPLVWGVLDPGVALPIEGPSRGHLFGAGHDPWGNRYVVREVDDIVLRWSPGPNGVDEAGRGDDIVLSPAWQRELHASSTELVLLLAGVFVGVWELRRLLRTQLAKPRAETLGPELARAAGLAIFLAALLGAGGLLVLQTAELKSPDTVAAADEMLVVPLSVAVAGCSYLLAFGFFLWLRLRQPREGINPSPTER